MRHLYRCQMRWADLDLLGHVNNVIYVDYLQEARVDMLRVHSQRPQGEELVDGVVVARHEVTYLAPITFRLEPISIECWVTEIRAASFTMAYEVFDETPEGRRVHLRASTVLTPYVFATESPRRITEQERAVLTEFLEPAPRSLRERPGPAPAGHTPYELFVRFSDVDLYGHVNNVKYFEYFQEGRVPLLRDIFRGEGGGGAGLSVVAHTDVDYRAPLLFRADSYVVRSWVAKVGRKSLTVEAEIADSQADDAVIYARSRVVMVFFDGETQRSREIPAHLRAYLESAVTPPS